ncbi:MAG: hypothetical protein AAFX58_01115, partial [Pseudomonadota bacterium]
FLSTPTQANPVVEVRFDLADSGTIWPLDLDESACRGVDWHAYRVTVDEDVWRRFTDELGLQAFELSVGFDKRRQPLRLHSFGVAVVDARAATTLWSCGCLQPLAMR